MARNVEKLDWVDYVPESYGNRSDDEPVRMEVHFLSAREYRRYQGLLKIKQKKGVIDVVNQDEVNRKILSDNVRNVRNYRIGDSEISDGGDLWDHGEVDFVEELLEVVNDLSRLEEGQAKNFEGPSAS